ncbi:GNAT family N-acetyltransferase [Virgibacillus profundi]|uniref:GNAT family N-acetyltransferase n=1 Tax=Virgibacillus profundi TaxID=2024555 RepID=A0A2A2I9A0_9BACI|nr:GNAT family N-acetyltransferase [Virgibacillus profundi]PAV27864.1 GNAT family N-acetyltransferase [Virgibacillus profundi]PXY52042.1 GNAT family N-acetyltransferase [Virgibacillus profundi]
MKNIKTLSEADHDAIFSLSQFAFQYELSEEKLRKKQEEVKRHKIWGWMEEDNLAAKLHLIPLSTYINGKEFKMGGISSVATWPEYRRQGMVKHLLKFALQHMKENGQTLSYLHPFSFGFYRKYGWEYTFSQKEYSIPLERLKRKWDWEGYVRRIQPDIPLLHGLYTEYTKKFNGMLVRDEKWWKQRVLTDKYQIAVAYNAKGQPQGYLIFNVKEKVFNVEEMVFKNLNGRKLLLEFIANHDSMVENVELVVPENDNLSLLLDEPRFEQKQIPYFMARIVDIMAFLKEYPFNNNGRIPITIKDDFLPENNGTYQLSIEDGKNNVTFLQSHGDHNGIQCSVQILTGMLLGFKRPMDYYQLGLLQGKENTVEQLENLIPNQQTYFGDFF